MDYVLYTAPTPNGQKVSIMLEELGAQYEVRVIDIAGGEQQRPWYLAINPNGRIPAIRDNAADFTVFDSGAILLYLAEKHDCLLPADPQGRSLAVQWLMFQMSGVGPMMGQANVFHRYLPEKLPLAIARFQAESRRLIEVMDRRLAENQFLAGEYSIADIANWPWVRLHFWSGVEIDDLANVQRWLAEVGSRTAVLHGASVPSDILTDMRTAASGAIVGSAAKMISGIDARRVDAPKGKG